MTPRTVYQVLEETVRLYGDAPALRQPEGDAYVTCSWTQYKQAVQEIAAGLRSLGIAKGDIVALNSETRMEFYLADLGIMTNGSIAAAMYPSYPAKDLVRSIESTRAKAVFVEDPATLQTLVDARVRLWILLTGEAEDALTLERLRALGRDAIPQGRQTRPGADPHPPQTGRRHIFPQSPRPLRRQAPDSRVGRRAVE